jgi:HSP20 family protein
MAITRWEPLVDIEREFPWHGHLFADLDRLQQQMNRMFGRMVPSGTGEAETWTFMPAAEMEETDTELRLKLEVPGMEAKDINLEVSDNAVEIKGERKTETKTEEGGVVRSEMRYGRFDRRIPLPTHIQSDQVQAEYKNGILSITLPKVATEVRKAVKIEVSS